MVTAALLALSACGRVGDKEATDRTTREVRVLVPAGLEEVVAEAGDAFERARSGFTVELDVAHIPELVAALDEGLPADVLIAPDERSMEPVLRRGAAAGTPRVVARHHLAIVVPAANPRRVTGLADLARGGMMVAICESDLPCGPPAMQALRRAGVEARTPVEGGPAAIVNKVAQGEVDAGVVFATAVREGGTKVTGVAIPPEENVQIGLPAVVLARARHPRGAAALLDFLTSESGATVFGRHGYGRP